MVKSLHFEKKSCIINLNNYFSVKLLLTDAEDMIVQEKGKFLYLDGTECICHEAAPTPPVEPVTAASARAALDELIYAISETGMNPVVQLLGYFTTEDPTYLPEGINTRNLAHRIGRDKLLKAMLEGYMETLPPYTHDFSDV